MMSIPKKKISQRIEELKDQHKKMIFNIAPIHNNQNKKLLIGLEMKLV